MTDAAIIQPRGLEAMSLIGNYTDELLERALKAEARVAELEHALKGVLSVGLPNIEAHGAVAKGVFTGAREVLAGVPSVCTEKTSGSGGGPARDRKAGVDQPQEPPVTDHVPARGPEETGTDLSRLILNHVGIDPPQDDAQRAFRAGAEAAAELVREHHPRPSDASDPFDHASDCAFRRRGYKCTCAVGDPILEHKARHRPNEAYRDPDARIEKSIPCTDNPAPQCVQCECRPAKHCDDCLREEADMGAVFAADGLKALVRELITLLNAEQPWADLGMRCYAMRDKLQAMVDAGQAGGARVPRSETALVDRMRRVLTLISEESTYDDEEEDEPGEDEMCEALCNIHQLALEALRAMPTGSGAT
jgi:hypothetical protein